MIFGFIRLFTLLSFVHFFLGCQTKPKEPKTLPVSSKVFSSESSAQIRDLKQKKTQNLNIDIFLQRPSNVRLEITALIGFPVASIAVTDLDVKAAIHTQKKFFRSKSAEVDMQRIMNFPIEPKNIMQMLLEQPLKGWSCDRDAGGVLSRCSLNGEILVTWTDRIDTGKRIIIRAPQFEMDWRVKNFEETELKSSNIFNITAPKSYTIQELN